MFLTVFIHKGGMAKTTTTINLAAQLARGGRPGIIVDLDAQQCDASKFEGSIPGVTFQTTLPHAAPEGGFVIVDTAPQIVNDTGKALLLSDIVVVPCFPLEASIEPLKRTFEAVAQFRQQKPDLGALPVFSNVARGAYTEGLMSGMSGMGEWRAARSTIGARLRDFDRAWAAKMPLPPKCAGSAQYAALASEIEELFGC